MDQLIINKLSQLEKTVAEFWNIPAESGNLLNIIIKASNYKKIIEVGTSNGYSTIWLAEAVKQTGGHVTGIEFSLERLKLAEDNLKECGLSEYATIKNGRAIEILSTLKEDELFDMAFIDANKGEYIKYYEILDKKIKPGGLIVADNVISHKIQVGEFLEAINNNPGYQISYLPFGGGLLIALKKVNREV